MNRRASLPEQYISEMAALFAVTDEIENHCMDKHKDIFKVDHFMKLRLKLLALKYMVMMCLWW